MRVSYCKHCDRRVKAQYDQKGMGRYNIVMCILTCGGWLPFALMDMWFGRGVATSVLDASIGCRHDDR
jgi:hypothetical protein